MLLLALILLAALWELYKLVIPDDGVRLGDALILPRSDDTSMPHLSQIFGAFGKQEVAGTSGTVASSVVSAVWYSLRLAGAILVEAHDEWQVNDRRYLSEGSMALLIQAPKEVAPAQLMPA